MVIHCSILAWRIPRTEEPGRLQSMASQRVEHERLTLNTFSSWNPAVTQSSINCISLCHLFANKGPYSQCYGFPSSHVRMWELDQKEGWGPKNWCFWTVVLEKTFESPLGCKEIQTVHPKGDQSGIFIGRTDVEAETPILWPPDVKSRLTGKTPEARLDWRQKEKGTAEDEMVGCHQRLNRHEFGQTPGDDEVQGSQTCCSPWGRRVGHNWVTEQLPSLPLWSCLHEAAEQRSQRSSSGQSEKRRCRVGLPEVGEETVGWGWVSISTNSSHHGDETGLGEVWGWVKQNCED